MVSKIMKVQILEPFITKKEKNLVNKSLSLNEVSTYGGFSKKFEKEIGKISKSKFNIAVNSGSAALDISYKAIGIQKNDIVIMPSYTFIATFNSIIHNNSRPWLFDIEKENFCLDLNQVEKALDKNLFKKGNFFFHKKFLKRVFAICPVLTFGIIPDLNKLKKIAKKFNLKIVIDGACSIGNKYKNQPLTKFADVVIYSFNGNKTITAGAGGVISTDKKNIYKLSRLYSNNGRSSKKYNYELVGYNYKMSSIHAAIGLAQLSNRKFIFSKKKEIRKIYEEALSDFPKLNNNINLWINFLICTTHLIAKKIISGLKKINIETDFFWQPIHKQKFKNLAILDQNFSNSENIAKTLIPLPSSSNLKKKFIYKIIKVITKIKNNE